MKRKIIPSVCHVICPCPPSVDAGKSLPIPYVYVNSSGSVKNYRPMQVVLACSLQMFAFPFDRQNCSLTFRSWLHSGPSVYGGNQSAGLRREEGGRKVRR